MMTLEQMRQNIFNKIEEVDRQKEVISKLDENILTQDGYYNFDIVNKYLDECKRLNYMQAAVVRMIRRIFKRIYGDWSFYDISYTSVVYQFKRFCC